MKNTGKQVEIIKWNYTIIKKTLKQKQNKKKTKYKIKKHELLKVNKC